MLNLFFFEGNKLHLVLEMNFDKVVIVGGSNNAGSGVGASTPIRLLHFFPKNTYFLSILWSKFLLKCIFK